MNLEWFGDSYDIVKKFFIGILKDAGYQVYIDPMFTGKRKNTEKDFLSFIGAIHFDEFQNGTKDTALFLDPDTGIGKRSTPRHCTIAQLLEHANIHQIVFSFDQSFSRGQPATVQMKSKLKHIKSCGGNGFYYDSHARFLFISRSMTALSKVRSSIAKSGLPITRLFAD